MDGAVGCVTPVPRALTKGVRTGWHRDRRRLCDRATLPESLYFSKTSDMASPDLIAACARLDRLHPEWTAVRRCAYPESILIHWESPDGLKACGDFKLQDIPGYGVPEYISSIEVQQICRNGADVNVVDIYTGYFCEGKNQSARPQKLRMRLHDYGHVILASAGIDVLIDGHIGEEAKAVSCPGAIMMVLSSGLDEPRTM